ncbi:hypothetical protein THASP1DRAFT_32372, partial [Thamnocephalis sphaerospora]
FGAGDFGAGDFGAGDFGGGDFGATDFGTTDFGATDFGATDFGGAGDYTGFGNEHAAADTAYTYQFHEGAGSGQGDNQTNPQDMALAFAQGAAQQTLQYTMQQQQQQQKKKKKKKDKEGKPGKPGKQGAPQNVPVGYAHVPVTGVSPMPVHGGAPVVANPHASVYGTVPVVGNPHMSVHGMPVVSSSTSEHANASEQTSAVDPSTGQPAVSAAQLAGLDRWAADTPYPAISIDSRDSQRTSSSQGSAGSTPFYVTSDGRENPGDVGSTTTGRRRFAESGEPSDAQDSVLLMEDVRDAIGTVSFTALWNESTLTSSRARGWPGFTSPDNTLLPLQEDVEQSEYNDAGASSGGSGIRMAESHPKSMRRRPWHFLYSFALGNRRKQRSKKRASKSTDDSESRHAPVSSAVAESPGASIELAPVSTHAVDSDGAVTSTPSFGVRRWWRRRRSTKSHSVDETDASASADLHSTGDAAESTGPAPFTSTSRQSVPTFQTSDGIDDERTSAEAVSDAAAPVSPTIMQPAMWNAYYAHNSNAAPSTTSYFANNAHTLGEPYMPAFAASLPPPIERPVLPARLYYYSEPYRRSLLTTTDSAHPASASHDMPHRNAITADDTPTGWASSQQQAEPSQYPQLSASQQYANDAGQLCVDGHEHHFKREYTMSSFCWLILLFPCGALCCYMSSKRRCQRCHQTL